MIQIDKTAELDLNKNKLTIDTSASRLHDLRSPVWNEAWSPLWYRDDQHFEQEAYDKSGAHYYIDDNKLMQNNGGITRELATVENGFSKNELAPALAYDNNWRLGLDLGIYKSGVLKYQIEDLGTVIHARIRELNGCLLAVVLYENASQEKRIKYLRLENDTLAVEHDVAWSGLRSLAAANSWSQPSTSLDLTDPLIWIGYNETTDAYGFTVFNTKGQSINPFSDLAYMTFIDHEGLVTNELDWHTGSETAQQDVTESIEYKTMYAFTTMLNVRQAYEIDGVYYDYDTKEQITFDVGYAPADTGTTQEIDGVTRTIYNYNLYSYSYGWIVPGKPETAVLSADYGTLIDGAINYVLTSNYNNAYGVAEMLSTQHLYVTYRDETIELPVASWQYTGHAGYTVKHDYSYTQTVTITNRGAPTCFGDDGYIYGVVHANDNTTINNAVVWSMKAQINSITTTSSKHTIEFSSTDYWQAPSNYRVFHGCSIDLAQGYIRWNGVFYGTVSGSSKSYTVVYDSALDDMLYYGGVQVDTSVLYDSNYLPWTSYGSINQLNEHFRVLINSAIPTGVSYSINKNQQGTLLAEWGNVDTEFYISATDDSVIYKENDKIYKIKTNETPSLQLLFNRYVVVNTTSFYNCYDITLDKLVHYALDWNNRAFTGYRQNSYLTNANIATVDQSNYNLFTTGINSNYTNEDTGILSLSIGPNAYVYSKDFGKQVHLVAAVSDVWPVDVYYGKDTALYQYSIMTIGSTKIQTQKTKLLGLAYPIAIGALSYFTPNIFTEYIPSYNNRDMVRSGRYAYLLSYIYGTEPSFSWTSASQQEDVDVIFVIQGQFYGVINDKLYSLVYSGQTLVQAEAIIDVTGLQFIGFVPTIAYFYSPMTKALYSFTGDANLTLLKECTEWNSVTRTFFNTATQTLFIQTETDEGPFLYVFAPSNTFRLPIEAKAMYFLDTAKTVITTDEQNYIAQYSPEKDLTPMVNVFATKLFGPGSAKWSNITKWHITLTKPSFQSGNGTIAFRDWKLTNVLTYSEETKREVKDVDWQNDVLELTYVPKMTKGQASGFSITTDYTIQSVTAETGIAGGMTPQTTSLIR